MVEVEEDQMFSHTWSHPREPQYCSAKVDGEPQYDICSLLHCYHIDQQTELTQRCTYYLLQPEWNQIKIHQENFLFFIKTTLSLSES